MQYSVSISVYLGILRSHISPSHTYFFSSPSLLALSHNPASRCLKPPSSNSASLCLFKSASNHSISRTSLHISQHIQPRNITTDSTNTAQRAGIAFIVSTSVCPFVVSLLGAGEIVAVSVAAETVVCVAWGGLGSVSPGRCVGRGMTHDAGVGGIVGHNVTAGGTAGPVTVSGERMHHGTGIRVETRHGMDGTGV